MAQKNSQNSLDNLMMAYADLSGGAKGSSFKGPALKDVKVQKSTAASYLPSQKARDWSSLEQSLESAFSVQQQQVASSQLPFQFAQPISTPKDEWGDFQDNLAPTQPPQPSLVQPQPSLVQPQTQVTNINTEDDDFADFVGPSTVGSRLATFQEESPVHNFKPKG